MGLFDVSTSQVRLEPAGSGRRPLFTALSVSVHAVAIGAAFLAVQDTMSPTAPTRVVQSFPAIPFFRPAPGDVTRDLPTARSPHTQKPIAAPPPENEEVVAAIPDIVDSPPLADADSPAPPGVVTGVFSTGLPLSLPPGGTGTVKAGVFGPNTDGTRLPLALTQAGPVVVGTFNGGAASKSGGTGGPTNVFTAPGGHPREAAPATTRPETRPAELLSPVTPRYTDEARRLRVTGEVQLRVLLSHSGDVRVLEVIKGLGHGLDESAIDAANRTRCRPALENDRPIDVVATITVTFKLG